jgi:hypothetical protein
LNYIFQKRFQKRFFLVFSKIFQTSGVSFFKGIASSTIVIVKLDC